MRRLICFTAMLVLSGCGSAEEPSQPPAATAPKTTVTTPAVKVPATKIAEEDAPGIAVGEQAPDFQLPDQAGEEQTLSGLLEKSSVALVFFRSAVWCPHCQGQLVQLQQNLEQYSAAGIQVVAISYDAHEVLKGFAESRSLTFPLLSDQGSATINAYGIHKEHGIPYPGTFLIDQQGIVRAKLFYKGYRDRHAAEELIEAAKKL